MRFFEVTAKCGHVGRGHYYEGRFYVRAENGKAAALLARQMPRVKHDHKDAILSVASIGYAKYLAGQATYMTNPYFNCHSRQEQRMYEDEILIGIHTETGCGKFKRHSDTDRQAKLNAMRRLLRKMDKHGFNNYDMGA